MIPVKVRRGGRRHVRRRLSDAKEQELQALALRGA